MTEQRLTRAEEPIEPDPKSRSRGIGIDMSPAAIQERLKIMSDLSRGCQALGQAKRIGKASDAGPQSKSNRRKLFVSKLAVDILQDSATSKRDRDLPEFNVHSSLAASESLGSGCFARLELGFNIR